MSNIAIVLGAGSGSRMNSDIKKQYMELDGKPLIVHSLKIMQDSKVITDVILVASPGDEEYCRKEIVDPYGLDKVRKIVAGGKERYHSVMAGLDAAADYAGTGDDHVFIHDGARPFVTEEEIEKLYADVRRFGACVAAVKSKDTVKISNTGGYVVSTPNRELTWIVQTPQVFDYELARKAYGILREEECTLECQGIKVTDDAMVVETWTGHKVKLTETGYENIKVTTPEDMYIAEAIIKSRLNK